MPTNVFVAEFGEKDIRLIFSFDFIFDIDCIFKKLISFLKLVLSNPNMSPITRSKTASSNSFFNTKMNNYDNENNIRLVYGADEETRDDVAQQPAKKVVFDEIAQLERVVNSDFPSLDDELDVAKVLANMKFIGQELSQSTISEKLTPNFMKTIIDDSVPFSDLLTSENRMKRKKNSGTNGIRHRVNKKHKSDGDLDVINVLNQVALDTSGHIDVFLEENNMKHIVYGNNIDVRIEVEMKHADAYCVEKKMNIREFTVCKEDGAVATLEGDVHVKKGDYIMKGGEGERWPLTQLKFKQTYTEKSVPEIYEYSTLAGGVFFAYLLLAIYFNFSNLSVNLISILYFAMFFPQKKIAIPKSKVVYAKQMREPFYVKVWWNDSALVGKADDYLLEYGIGDYGVVDKEIFEKTYSILD